MAKQTFSVKLYLSELIYDIENKSHLMSRSLETADNAEQAANVQVDGDKPHRNQVLRSIQSAIDDLKLAISEWGVATSVSMNGETDELMSTTPSPGMNSKVMSVVLSVPMNFDNSVRPTIASAMHRYVVDKTLAEWYGITDKQDAAAQAQAAAADLQTLQAALFRRVRPQRPQ